MGIRKSRRPLNCRGATCSTKETGLLTRRCQADEKASCFGKPGLEYQLPLGVMLESDDSFGVTREKAVAHGRGSPSQRPGLKVRIPTDRLP